MKSSLHSLLAIIVSAVALTIPTDAAAQTGEKSLGVRTGYNTRNESAVGGIVFQYRFCEHFRLAPEIDYIFRHAGTDAFSFNGNAHFPFAISRGLNIYPFTGLNYTSWNTTSNTYSDDIDDVSTRSGKFGLNIGGGLEYYATTTLKVSLEGKFCWVNRYDTGTFTIGISYLF